ncbi:MAG: type II toxin-antitoxin system RelE/ParE family toxin [Flavobacteriales bacterium]|nr:type II toxin-antitoxin system RelE/ParE family toxin [Flavobacteriales bacterium]
MVEVKWTVDAITDIDGIATYIARDSPRSAKDMVDRFFAAADLLIDQPLRGKPVPEANIPAVRELLVGSYRLIYLVVNKDRVDVLAIHHQKRRSPRRVILKRLRKR